MICPLHGPMLTEGLEEYLRLYDLWAQWKPEEPESILIVHASIHGNTAYASEALKSKLEGKGVRVTMCDLTVTFTKYRKTHNEGVFSAYTDEMIAARRSAIITGLRCV